MSQSNTDMAATELRVATGASAAQAGPGSPTSGLAERAMPYLFLAPYLMLFLVFVIVPAIFGLWISLHNWDFLLPGKPFVGLQNYTDLFSAGSGSGANFWQAMRATSLFTVLSVPFLLALPLLIAVVLNSNFKGRTFFRAAFFSPYVLGVAVIGILFRFILDRSIGILNAVLGVFGVPEIAWLSQVPYVWVSLVGATVWWTLGFNTVIYLAGLQEIDREQYEAASIDGATAWEKFRHITIPGLRPVLLLVTTTTVLASANMFGQALLITQGAPANSTRTAIMYIAEEGLVRYRMGSASAMSYMLMIFLMLISLGIFALFRRWED